MSSNLAENRGRNRNHTGHEPSWACGLLALLPTRQADRPLHLKDFAQHIGTKDLSRATLMTCMYGAILKRGHGTGGGQVIATPSRGVIV
jgi:hypothetical protein